MHQTPQLTPAQAVVYHDHLQTDHDFRVWCEVLTMEEEFVTEADMLDGQVNFTRGQDGPERTASITLSDPDNALAFGTQYAADDTGTLWVNRLLRAQHAVYVPRLGFEVQATAFIGVPTSVGRSGAELNLELGDKSLLADHGVRHRTYKKGSNVRSVLVSILRDLTGERHFRIPTTRKKLSQKYTVGMGDDAVTPWDMFKRIAGKEMGWRAFYSNDGYATCEPTSAVHPLVTVHSLLELPNASTSFDDFINYAKVTSHRKPKQRKKDKDDDKKKPKPREVTQIIFEGVAVLPNSNRLSEQSLARNGVPRTLPLVVTDDDLKTQKEVTARARSELQGGSGLDSQQSYETIPFFDLEPGDRLALPQNVGVIPFTECSIPLGVGGNMTIGAHKWVSRPVKVRRVRSKKTVIRKRAKGGSKHEGKRS